MNAKDLRPILDAALSKHTSRCLDDAEDYEAVLSGLARDVSAALRRTMNPKKGKACCSSCAKGKACAAKCPRRKNPGHPAYEKTHWGDEGTWSTKATRVPDPHKGDLVVLGRLHSVVYVTRKGGDTGLTEYEHKFSGGGPWLVFNGEKKLIIAGGSYSVTERGIVG